MCATTPSTESPATARRRRSFRIVWCARTASTGSTWKTLPNRTSNVAPCSGTAGRGIYHQGAPNNPVIVENCLVFDNNVGLESAFAGDIDSDWNNIGGNGTDYHANVAVGANDVVPAVDPLAGTTEIITLDPPAGNGYGKLKTTSTLANRGSSSFIADAPANRQRFLRTDIEGEARPYPNGGDPDIGADELSAGGGAGVWYFVDVVPPDPDAYFTSTNGTRHAAIGRIPAGSLLVTLGVSGTLPTTVYLVPQGANRGTTDVTELIPLRRITAAGTTWYGTNDEDIETVVRNYVGAENVPDQGDIIADGHAFVLPKYNGSEMLPSEDQVRVYRHVLIDTIPPIMYDPPVSAEILAYLNNVAGHSESPGYYAAEGLPMGAASTLHPYPALPSNWRPSEAGINLNGGYPYDDGLIDEIPGTSNGSQAFFNVGSISNNIPADNEQAPTGGYAEPLDIDVVVAFIDPPVRDPNGDVILGTDDLVNTMSTRQVAGFPSDTDGTAGTADDYTGYTDGPAQWELVENTTVPTGVDVRYDVAATGPNPGYEFGDTSETNALDSASGLQNRGEEATWLFEYEDSFGTTVPGIYWYGGNRDHLHLAMKFVAKDIAGNETLLEAAPIGYTDDTMYALDPFHIWWMFKARTQVQPYREGQEVTLDKAFFSWQLQRGFNPNAASNPRPIYTYRLWRSTAPGGDKDAVYEPVIAWTDWAESNRSLSQADLENINDNIMPITGYWLLLVAAGADEAGNVEPWPVDLPLPDTSSIPADQVDLVTFPPTGTGMNWQRFFLQPAGKAIDTQVTVQFWVNGRAESIPPVLGDDPGDGRLGVDRLVPVRPDDLNQEVVAQFLMTPTFPSPGAGEKARVYMELTPQQGTTMSIVRPTAASAEVLTSGSLIWTYAHGARSRE